MFDLTSSKLLILGLVALIVVGPKELPMLLRTIGKYMGMIRRQANEFRAQFDDAMRETELEQLKKDVEGMGRDMQATVRDAELSVEREVANANAEVESAMTTPAAPATTPPAIEAPHSASADQVAGSAAEPMPVTPPPPAPPAPSSSTAHTSSADAAPQKSGA